MENNKYYTPDITEFRVGFEYEVFSNYNLSWEKSSIKNMDNLLALKEFQIGRTRPIKVKYLDAQDIEELGWKVNVITHDYGYVLKYDKPYKDDFAHFIIDRDRPKYCIITIPEKDIDGDFIRVTVFKGTILNKSELQWILTKVEVL